MAAALIAATIAAEAAGVRAADLVVVDAVPVRRLGPVGRVAPDAAQRHGVAEDRGAELGEHGLGDDARGHPRRGLAGARALEHVAGVAQAVLLHPDQVGVARGAGR